jgi:hypothetical protein
MPNSQQAADRRADVTADTRPAGLEVRLRDIQSITDAALSRLDDHDLLAELLERTRAILQADTAAEGERLVEREAGIRRQL